jgi:hypothetical protein
MRTTIGILALGLILAIGASSAQADTSTPTFACTTCSNIPTAPDVTFPSPSIQMSWDNITDFLTLASGDLPTDTYTWSNSLSISTQGPEVADYFLSITDVTTGDFAAALGSIGIDDPFFSGFTDSGTLTFSTPGGGGGGTNPVPEPGSIVLLLAGISTMLATRKFRTQT